jgi:hypothetical protein
MTICVRGVLRRVASRMTIAVMASAVVVGMLPPHSEAVGVIETASIVEQPTTVGIADSNL